MSLVNLNQKQNGEIEISKQTNDLEISNKNNIQSMQKKQTRKTQIPLGITFAEKKTKKAWKLIPSKTQTEREPQTKGTSTPFWLSVAINSIELLQIFKEFSLKSFQ